MPTSIDTIILQDGTLSTPDVSKLTTNSLDGTGVFDILMRATKTHLQEEYNNDRITGQEYSTVYLGALAAVLQQSVNFLLSHQQEEKIVAEISLLRQQTVTELAQTDDDLPIGLGFNGDTHVEGLVKAKKDLNLLQADLINSQITQSNNENALLGQKIITELARTDDDITQANVAGHGFNSSAAIAGLMREEQRLVTQKVVTEVSQTSDTKPVSLGEMSTTASITGSVKSQKDLLAKQTDKALAEKILLAQKTITELAQTSDTIDITTDALNTNIATAGSVQKQKDLFDAQAVGFARDAEQKVAKMMIDAWAVDATVGSATANATNKLDDASLGAVVTRLKTGIGV